MIITDKFIMLNWPKTGSTFVRSVLKRIHGIQDTTPPRGFRRIQRWRGARGINGLREFYFPNENLPEAESVLDQHGGYSRALGKFKHLPVAMVVRNPLDRAVSSYLYKSPQPVIDRQIRLGARDRFPHFPNVSFEEFIELRYGHLTKVGLQGHMPKTVLGWQALDFVRMVFKDPPALLANIDDNYIVSGAYKNDMADITFLANETLNDDLVKFLVNAGYPRADVEFIHEEKRIQPPGGTIRQDTEFMKYYTPSLERRVRDDDWVLFKLLKDFGFDY